MVKRPWIAPALLAGLVLLADRAHAQQAGGRPCPQQVEAGALKEKGDRAMDTGRPAEALSAYEQAFSMCKEPALLYNLAKVHVALADSPRALAYFEQFDRDAPAKLKERTPQLQQFIEEQRGKVASVTVTSSVPGARVRIREKTVGETPFSAPLRVNAGKALVEVAAEGYLPFSKEVDLPAGRVTVVAARLVSRNQSGVLVVKSPVEDTLVFVDGSPFGKAPVEHEVAVGSHRVLVRRDGYREVDRQVSLALGERKELTLSPEYIRPLTQKWWFWTGVGVALAAGVTTTLVVLNTEKSPDRGTLAPGSVVAGTSYPFRF